MGILRSIGKGIGGLVFTLSLAGLIFSIGLVQFTEYENLKEVFSEILSSQIEGGVAQAGTESGGTGEMTEEELGEMYQAFLQICEGEESVELPIQESEESITIDCNELRTAQSEEEGIKGAIGEAAAVSFFVSFFDGIYYKEYDCAFLDCIQAGQMDVMLSAHGHEFLKQIQVYFAAGIAAGVALILISAERWSARLKGLGWPLVATGISYLFLKFGEGIMSSKLPGAEQTGVDVMSLIDKMFAPMMDSFLIALVVGIVLTASGYALAYKDKRKPAKVRKVAKAAKKTKAKQKKIIRKK